MPRKTNSQLTRRNGREDARKGITSADALRFMERQVRRLDDKAVFELLVSAEDSDTRKLADRVAHERAEAYALGQGRKS